MDGIRRYISKIKYCNCVALYCVVLCCPVLCCNVYLLLAECEVRTASYGLTEFFPSFYGPSAKCAGHENKEGKNEDP